MDKSLKIEERVGDYISKVSEDLKSNDSVNVNTLDFNEFNVKSNLTESGEYIFDVEQKFLKEATKILGLSSQSGSGLIGITIFKDRMKLSNFNQIVFSEIFIPLVETFDMTGDVSINSAEKIEEVCFFFERELFNKIALKFVNSVIRFKFIAEKNILVVFSENTRLELAVASEPNVVNYHLKLNNPKYVCKVDVDRFRDAIKYISYFVQKNEIKKNLSQADCTNRMLYGGSYSSVGIYESYEFNFMNLNVRVENLAFLHKMLSYFNKHNTHFFETENYYLIRDENLYFGFEKSRYTFPSVEKFLESKVFDDKIVIDRVELLESLNKLSIVLSGGESLIKFKVSRMNDKVPIFRLYVKDASGRISTDVLKIIRGNEEKDIEFVIELEAFMKVISHFNSEKVCIQYSDKALIVRDEGKDYKVMSNFSSSLENNMSKI